jgi:hypothetical protein
VEVSENNKLTALLQIWATRAEVADSMDLQQLRSFFPTNLSTESVDDQDGPLITHAQLRV